MIFLPIVERELRVAARLTRTFQRRMAAAGIVATVAVLLLYFGGFSRGASRDGGMLFETLTWIAFVFCLSDGSRRTSDCLSMERREGTLGLLFLTDLKGYDVVLGKLAANSLDSFYSLLAVMPIMALPLLLGGVLPSEYWRRVLVLMNVLFFSLSAGIWVSSRSIVARRAERAASWFLLACFLVPLPFWETGLATLSPAYGFAYAMQSNYFASPAAYWMSLLLTHVIAWALLAAAAVRVSKFREDGTEGPMQESAPLHEAPPLFEPSYQPARAARPELLNINPILWLVTRCQGELVLLPVVTVLSSAVTVLSLVSPSTALGVVAFMLPVNFILKVQIAGRSCRTFADARSKNTLEMLLCAPLTIEQIAAGQQLWFKRNVRPLLIAGLAVQFVVLVIGVCVSSEGLTEIVLPIFAGLAYLGITAVDYLAIMWAGIWFGMTAKNENDAASKTAAFVCLAPFLSLGVLPLLSLLGFEDSKAWLAVAAPFFIAWPFFSLWWARKKVLSEFRLWATQRFESPKPGDSWWPFPAMRTRRA